MLSATDVSFRYDADEPVLTDVSLHVERGRVLAIIGPSGTGKTTLLRLLALFHRPDEGQVTVDGRDVWSLSDRERLAVRRRLGMVFQDRSLFSTTVGRNAAYGLDVRRSWSERLRSYVDRLDSRAVPQAAHEALEAVGMAEDVDRPARELSAGEAQRVAFARALAPDPDALLLDEPTSNLDPRNTALIEEAVERARARNISVVLATHDMDQARRVADDVAVFLDGTTIEQGSASHVFDGPDDDRARQFVAGELVY